MIIITTKNDDRVLEVVNDTTDKEPKEGTTKTGNSNLGVWDNGYPVLIEEDVAFPTESVNVYQNVDNVPYDKYLKAGKYKYTSEDGFTINSDWVAPDETNTYGIPDELFNQIKSDYREQLTSEVTKNGYNS